MIPHGANRPPLRTRLAVAMGVSAALASRMLRRGHGASVGGWVALRVDPHALGHLAKGKAVTLVSGTNGKSTTTRLLAHALRADREVAATRGANIPSGLLEAVSSKAPELVLEVDELYLPHVLRETKARVLVLLNITRDQLDRMNELSRIAQTWREAIAGVDWDMAIVANASDPWVVRAVGDYPNVIWISTSVRWQEEDGGNVGAEEPSVEPQPAPTWTVDGSRVVHADGTTFNLASSLPGQCNLDNTAVALAAALCRGSKPEAALAAMKDVKSIDGRYLFIERGPHRLQLFLTKNPASWAEALNMLRGGSAAVVVCVNARGADGRDPSWLWDVPFEQLAGRPVGLAGDRVLDLAVRFEVAGIDAVRADSPLEACELLPPGDVAMLCTYTAFHELAEDLGVNW